MHGRHRSPGDRSVAAGAGAAHSGYRSFGRGGGGYRRSGQPKPSSYAAAAPPPPPPPRRRADVLLEAGRLAAEYLVAKGLLPAVSLPPMTAARPWTGEDGGEGGRASALSRLGRRRFDDEQAGFEERNHKGRGGRRRQRNGSFNRHEWGRENGRGGPWSETTYGEELDRPRRWHERGRGFLDPVDGEDLDRHGGFEEDARHGGGGIDSREPSVGARVDDPPVLAKSEVAGDSESGSESDRCAVDSGSKTMEDSVKGDRAPAPQAEENLERKGDDAGVSDLEMEEAGELKENGEIGACGESQAKNGLQEEVVVASHPSPVTEDKQATNQSVNLLTLCGFAKVPTKPRSSVANRSPRSDHTPNTEVAKEANDDNSVEGVFGAKMLEIPALNPSSVTFNDRPQNSGGLASEISAQSTSSDSLTGQRQSSSGLVPVLSGSQSVPLGEESAKHDLMSSVENRCTRANSFPDTASFVDQQQETSQGPPGFELSGKVLDARVDEGLDDLVRSEGMKRQREWSPSQIEVCFRNLRAKSSGLPAEKLSPDHEMLDDVEDEQLRDAGAFPNVVVDSQNRLEKRRQLASSSFKICDLNLMEAPEVTDIPNDPVLECIPSTSAPLMSENSMSVDFGLSIGQRCNDTDGYGRCSSVDKVVPVIDLEDDSPVQVIACDTSKTGSVPVYPNLENFLNHPENPVDLPDIQDGYGLTISEFLGNDIAGCAAVQGDITNLQAGMPFHGTEGMTGVDDPLYVALGEIPIGFMDVWDQPPPEYGKFF